MFFNLLYPSPNPKKEIFLRTSCCSAGKIVIALRLALCSLKILRKYFLNKKQKRLFKNLPIRPIRTAIKVTQSNFILIQFFVTLLTFYLLLEEHVAPIKSESNSRKFKHLPTKCVTVTQQQHCRSCRGSSSALFVLFFFQSFLKWIQLD